MTDALLTPQDQEEALSRAYAEAVAAKAGYVVGTDNLDRDGVDMQIKAGGNMRPALDIQLKATINLGEPQGGFYKFPLKVRNYEKLRITTQTPRLLVVLDLPEAEEHWLTITTKELVIRRCAYWLSLEGGLEVQNKENITVAIPETNIFDVDGLRVLMEKSRKGGIR